MNTLCVCVIMKNEERFIEKCLQSVRDYIDEIRILDTGSIDKSIYIAKKFTSNVYYEKFNGDFSSMRNKLLRKVESDWILFLDADEYFNVNDMEKVRDIIQNKDSLIGGITFYRYNFFSSGGWYSGRVLKLFRNNAKFQYEGIISESINKSIEDAGYKIIDSDILLNHIGHYRSRLERDKKCRYYIDMFQKQLENQQNNAILHGYIGLNARILGDFDFALRKINVAMEINPSSATLNMFKGHILRSINKNEEALDFYFEALRIRDNDSSILNMIGVMYMTMGKFVEAANYFSYAYEQNHTLIHSLLNLGLLRLYEGKYMQALELFNEVVERNPAFLNFDIHNNLECDPFRVFYYESVMCYPGLPYCIAICRENTTDIC